MGELDEECVYESRVGETIILGATTWRIEEITRERVVVTPAPGQPGKMPFWHGDQLGRPYELGQAVGAVPPRGRRLDRRAAARRLRARRAGDQQPARLPRRGARVHRRARCPPIASSSSSASATSWATGGSACSRRSARGCTRRGRWRSRRASASDSTSRCSASGATTASSCGCPRPTSRPSVDIVLVDPDEVEELVVNQVGNERAVRVRFRENAARALLLPRRRPGFAHAAVADAPAGADLLGGGVEVRRVPDPARDLSRVPARRVRPSRDSSR